MEGIVTAWGRILLGYTPNLSIEITRECPLSCPGCYAYGTDHLGGAITLREVSDLKGQPLVNGILGLLERHRPIHVSLVGGEPLVRYRELGVLLPELARRGIYTQLVTSAVRPIPGEWAALRRLQIVVSIDGLQPEHDERRKPATYDRILKHIDGHRITVHCTVTRQQAGRVGYLEEFTRFWSAQPSVHNLWFSLYTPQVGEESPEMLRPEDRRQVVGDLMDLRGRYPKIAMPKGMVEAFLRPPHTPEECVFARTTTCVSADFSTPIMPCQFGGKPDCANCGCIASMGLAAVARHRLRGGLRVGAIFETSLRVGSAVARTRARLRPVAWQACPDETP
jgi:MoaA/NifB/PqqE/SkfB family radical SAM enzyme